MADEVQQLAGAVLSREIEMQDSAPTGLLIGCRTASIRVSAQ